MHDGEWGMGNEEIRCEYVAVVLLRDNSEGPCRKKYNAGPNV